MLNKQVALTCRLKHILQLFIQVFASLVKIIILFETLFQ